MILSNAFCLGLLPFSLSGLSRFSIGAIGDHPGISLVFLLLSCCWNKPKHSRSSRVAFEAPTRHASTPITVAGLSTYLCVIVLLCLFCVSPGPAQPHPFGGHSCGDRDGGHGGGDKGIACALDFCSINEWLPRTNEVFESAVSLLHELQYPSIGASAHTHPVVAAGPSASCVLGRQRVSGVSMVPHYTGRAQF